MERDEFIKNLGLGLIAVCGASSLAACSSKGTPSPSTTTVGGGGGSNTVSVDLTTKLLNVNDQIVSAGVLIFRIAASNVPASFVATESICPHQGGGLSFIPAKSYIQCNLHQSEYSETGTVLQGPVGFPSGSTRALKIYNTTIASNTLTVTVA